jgi:hypothetical protein
MWSLPHIGTNNAFYYIERPGRPEQFARIMNLHPVNSQQNIERGTVM